MADYFDYRHSSHDISYRGADPAADENAMHRSVTRGSHQSQASVSASTRSWVMSNQANPPPPPQESESSAALTPLRLPRPLPEPQYQQTRVPVPYGLGMVQGEDDDDFMHINSGEAQFPFDYQSEGLGRGRPAVAGPMSLPDIQQGPSGNRSFVGGFFKGLKRLPKMLKGGSGGEKRRLVRKGTFGTDGTSTTATGITRGNTLPRYLSNPSIGPSNPQFAHRLSMAVASGSLHPDATPAEFQLRSNPAGPQLPSITVTNPSGRMVEEERADFYDGPTADHDQLADILEHEPSLQERATVMVYGSDSQAPTIIQPISSPPVRRPSTPAARVSYQAELPTRASAQAQTEPLAATAPPNPLSPMRPIPPPQPVLSPKDTLSPSTTSPYTISAVTSVYDPSFSSDLGPIEKFFKGFYHLPWIAHERVTVDYRPGDSKRAKHKVKGGLKKPMASWYRAIVTRSRRASRDLDLLSSGTVSTSARTSLRNSLSPLASPTSRRSGRSPNHRHHSSRPKHHHRARRHTTSTTTDMQQVPQRSNSPLIPTPYPYTYPAYQYPYPYGGYTAMPIPQPAPPPRGPRSHRRHKAPKYPDGYTTYQPMAMPPQPMPPGPPIYFINPSPPQSQTGGDGGQMVQQSGPQGQPQGPVQMSPVIMHYVPGAFNPNPTMVSPPLTPQRPTAYGPT
ncbi:hypothetical protein BDZ97DRAFT_1918980 [Flammula alnicola]|nr:hypothetical protein BDZ97DRAFT_1918980 [Flammula alnicola]